MSMQTMLDAMKYHLIEILFARAYAMTDCKFNIIAFSGKVKKYCDNLIDCTLQKVEKTIPWIRSLECRTGRNMQHALAVALDDPSTDAVYLMTDGKLDINPHKIYTVLRCAARGRPVHTLCTMEKCSTIEVNQLLEQIAWLTGASLQAAMVCKRHGAVEQLIPVSELHSFDLLGLHCSETPVLNRDNFDLTGLPHIVVPFSWCTLHPDSNKVKSKGDLINSYAGELIRGVRVLARRENDGYYYLGRLGNEIERCPGRFLVEFDKNKKKKLKAQSRLKATAHFDIMHYEDAKRHGIGPGCRVLAPWEPDMERYGPGTVLEGREERGLNLDHDDGSEGLVVSFWNGKTDKVPPGTAVWIPQLLAERIILELQMTTSAKQKLLETYPDYPLIVPPGYRSCQSSGDKLELAYHSRVPCVCQGLYSNCSHRLCRIPDNLVSHLNPRAEFLAGSGDGDAMISGAMVTKEEVSQEVTKKLSQPFRSNSSTKEQRVKSTEFMRGNTTSLQKDIEKQDSMKTSEYQSASLCDLNRNKHTNAGSTSDISLVNGFHYIKDANRRKLRGKSSSISLQKKTG
ncbi:uncharacterized protein [Mobula birostris]